MTIMEFFEKAVDLDFSAYLESDQKNKRIKLIIGHQSWWTDNYAIARQLPCVEAPLSDRGLAYCISEMNKFLDAWAKDHNHD